MKRLNIDGYIIGEEDKWLYDLFEIPYVTLAKMRAFLIDAKEEDVEVVVNCFGGDVWAGAAMYDELRQYKGKTTARVVGLSASASTFVMLGCDRVVSSPMASYMIHNAATGAEGDYRVMEHTADLLKKINDAIVNAYEIKTGKSRDELKKYMDEETWMSAQDALELGLVDEIDLKDGEKLSDIKPSAMASTKIAACFNPVKMHEMAEKFKPVENRGVSQPVSNTQTERFNSIRQKLTACKEGK